MTVDSQPPSEGRFVTRLARRCEIPRMTAIRYDAFAPSPHNTTPDELSRLLETEPDPELGRTVTREESLTRANKTFQELFDKNKYHIVGVYHTSSTSIENQQGDLHDSSDLPPDAIMTGFALWHRIDSSTEPDSPETDEKERQHPGLLNRFMAQLNRTRERVMKGERYWFLKLLVIDPEWQRKGLGTMLVKWGTARADQEGVVAWLESSPMGKGTYLKAGFKVAGLDRVDEKRAAKGFVEWPYMVHDGRKAQ
ncbi:acetyltransferase [Pseudozyma hubeiensis SY62]|uniref:Acetyltransferase n=1 Tax=Pseudozyma hubeiensis (strain SY62) TaxID=1305764 RepID=R9NZZ1_PSEHS|nr:acetyltransferase [Pseudozyma hubeiensis SY62]GAC94411.1 acetyltransferase [Pseudozyma hubeiensis SY62]